MYILGISFTGNSTFLGEKLTVNREAYTTQSFLRTYLFHFLKCIRIYVTFVS